MKKSIGALLLIFLLGSCLAMAQDRRMVRKAASADTDGDGVVTQEEFLAQQTLIFQKMDTDGDGVLADNELKRTRVRKRMPHASGMLFKVADTNQDGEVDSVEWQNALTAIDGDADGIVDIDAFMAFTGMNAPDEILAQKLVKSLDRNGDGESTTKEVGAVFGRWDYNSDGVISGRELPRSKPVKYRKKHKPVQDQ